MCAILFNATSLNALETTSIDIDAVSFRSFNGENDLLQNDEQFFFIHIYEEVAGK